MMAGVRDSNLIFSQDQERSWMVFSRMVEYHGSSSFIRNYDREDTKDELVREVVAEVHCWVKRVDDYWSRHMDQSSALTVDAVVGLVDSILDNAADFLSWEKHYLRSRKFETGVTDDFEVQITFLRSLLLFAKQTGVEDMQLQNVLLKIHPFVINASRVFIQDQTEHHRLPYAGLFDLQKFEALESSRIRHDNLAHQWSQFESKCSTLSIMGTGHQVWGAYMQAL